MHRDPSPAAKTEIDGHAPCLVPHLPWHDHPRAAHMLCVQESLRASWIGEKGHLQPLYQGMPHTCWHTDIAGLRCVPPLLAVDTAVVALSATNKTLLSLLAALRALGACPRRSNRGSACDIHVDMTWAV